MSVTIHDVARRAGVSIATVSRVLNNTCKVREDKRLLVLEAARDLGYSPNPAALSLLNKKTGALGVLLPSVHGEFFSELLNTLDEAARENELILVISTSHRHEAEFQKAMQFLDKRVDGLIVMAPELDAPAAASIASKAASRSRSRRARAAHQKMQDRVGPALDRRWPKFVPRAAPTLRFGAPLL